MIRGLGTPNNSAPLIVVDGIPDVDINRVNVNDIETISVLKDASSASCVWLKSSKRRNINYNPYR